MHRFINLVAFFLASIWRSDHAACAGEKDDATQTYADAELAEAKAELAGAQAEAAQIDADMTTVKAELAEAELAGMRPTRTNPG